jgi:hypothetical protein
MNIDSRMGSWRPGVSVGAGVTISLSINYRIRLSTFIRMQTKAYFIEQVL